MSPEVARIHRLRCRARAAGRGIKRTVGDAHKRENHGDLYPDRQHREKRPQRAMGEVGEDKFVDQDFKYSGAGLPLAGLTPEKQLLRFRLSRNDLYGFQRIEVDP